MGRELRGYAVRDSLQRCLPLCGLALDRAALVDRARLGDEVAQGRNHEAKLGVASAMMIALGYPGEIQDDLTQRWFWWALAMLPFCFVVGTLLSGLDAATSKQPESVKGLVRTARYLTVVSWLTYPFVYIIKNMGLKGAQATTYEQVGYSIADVVAKAVFGLVVWSIAAAKSEEEGN